MTFKKVVPSPKGRPRRNGEEIPIIEVVPRKGYWAIYSDRREWYDDPTAGTPYALNPFAGIEKIKHENMDYSQFDQIVKEKRKKSKFLTMEAGETAVFTFLSMEAIKRQNPISGEVEDAWLVKLLDEEGNEKQWTFTGLGVFNQFKEQNIQENDKIRVSKVKQGNRTRYLVEKMAINEEGE